MGLEIVELVLAVEESFDIDIPDEHAQKIATPRQLVDYLARRLETASANVCLSQRAFYRLRRALRSLDGDASTVCPESSLLPYFPRATRKARWQALTSALSAPLPPLRRPPALSLIGVFLLATSTVVIFRAAGGFPAFLALVLASTAFIVVTRPFRVVLPFASAADLSHHLALHHSRSLVGAVPRWSYSQIESVTFGLIREVTGLQHFDADGQFVRDLGLD
jgi:hypothetical protein